MQPRRDGMDGEAALCCPGIAWPIPPFMLTQG